MTAGNAVNGGRSVAIQQIPHLKQVRQREQREDLRGVLDRPLVADLPVLPLAFHHLERMRTSRANTWRGLVVVRHRAERGWLRALRRFIRYLMPAASHAIWPASLQ